MTVIVRAHPTEAGSETQHDKVPVSVRLESCRLATLGVALLPVSSFQLASALARPSARLPPNDEFSQVASNGEGRRI
jgi:hypothetical protein